MGERWSHINPKVMDSRPFRELTLWRSTVPELVTDILESKKSWSWIKTVQGNVNGGSLINYYLDGLNGLRECSRRLGHKVVGETSPTVFVLASGVLTQSENFQSRSHAFPLVQAAYTYQSVQAVNGSFGPRLRCINTFINDTNILNDRSSR